MCNQLGLCLLEQISYVYFRAFVIVIHICLFNQILHLGLDSYHAFAKKHLNPEFEIETYINGYPFYKEMSFPVLVLVVVFVIFTCVQALYLNTFYI